MSLISVDQTLAKENFLQAPFSLEHGLCQHPLFSLERLIDLAKTMPRDRIEYNCGQLQPGQSTADIPSIDMPPAEVIKRIQEANAWMVIKNVEEDPDYFAVLQQFIVAAQRAVGKNTTAYLDLQGFIFISSAHSITPFHVDMEENILIQIRGDKWVHVFENNDRLLVSEQAMEISPAKHRNQDYQAAFEERAQIFAMQPGDALHIPYTWPHWVKVGDEYSISMAMTWKTPAVKRLNKIRLMNGTLRRLGLPQQAPGRAPILDACKVLVHDMFRLLVDPLRKQESTRRLLRGLIYGKQANYYYDEGKPQ
ncbi:MAG: cupin-like domain-containing protein [Methylococcales bacterium]